MADGAGPHAVRRAEEQQVSRKTKFTGGRARGARESMGVKKVEFNRGGLTVRMKTSKDKDTHGALI